MGGPMPGPIPGRVAERAPAGGPKDALVLVDCTLRDGGFHTAWDFDPALIASYLRAVDEAGIDYAEIGYRSLAREGFAGALRFTDEALVGSLPELAHTRLAVMIDAK